MHSRLRQLIRQILVEGFAEDLQNVKSGREAKQVFSKYVDQDYFRKGTLVHWVGPGFDLENREYTETWEELSKLINNPDSKSELSCNFYKPGEKIDFIPYGTLKNVTQGLENIRGKHEEVVGVVVKGWVTYAANQNIFTGKQWNYNLKDKSQHRKRSSGINKYPWENYKSSGRQKQSGVNYLDQLRDSSSVDPTGRNMNPIGDSRPEIVRGPWKDKDKWKAQKSQEIEDQSWMEYYKNWNEVLVDNWKVVGLVWAEEPQSEDWFQDYRDDYDLGDLPIKYLPDLEIGRKPGKR